MTRKEYAMSLLVPDKRNPGVTLSDLAALMGELERHIEGIGEGQRVKKLIVPRLATRLRRDVTAWEKRTKRAWSKDKVTLKVLDGIR